MCIMILLLQVTHSIALFLNINKHRRSFNQAFLGRDMREICGFYCYRVGGKKNRFLNVTDSTTTHKCALWALVYMANSTVIELALSFLYKASLWDRSHLTSTESSKLSFFMYSSHNQKFKLRDTALFIKVIFNCLFVLFSICGLTTVISLTAETFK